MEREFTFFIWQSMFINREAEVVYTIWNGVHSGSNGALLFNSSALMFHYSLRESNRLLPSMVAWAGQDLHSVPFTLSNSCAKRKIRHTLYLRVCCCYKLMQQHRGDLYLLITQNPLTYAFNILDNLINFKCKPNQIYHLFLPWWRVLVSKIK